MRASALAGKATVALGLLLAPLAVGAQPAGRVYRVGFLLSGQMRPQYVAEIFDPLRAGLRDLGYVEGRNFTLEIRSAEGKLDRPAALAAELIGLPVDVLMVGSGSAKKAAQAASRPPPVVLVAILTISPSLLVRADELIN